MLLNPLKKVEIKKAILKMPPAFFQERPFERLIDDLIHGGFRLLYPENP